MLPAIEYLDSQGLKTVYYAQIEGSSITAEVTIQALRANEINNAALNPETTPLLPLVEFDPNTDECKRATPSQRRYVRGRIGKYLPFSKAPRIDYATIQQCEQILAYFNEPTEPLHKQGRDSMKL
ncbi:hypothetical protein [Corynebacterium rouxii]|uniref:Uncharacterized protein n=1 Tax=Corynebacterium rouxii TaxID=2719119 RepID=A0A6I8MH97_9CORY|nr:hypothetical protein [Corynebacterium rouxii]VZH85946.1 hypothetical protein FRC0190_01878 [Corynebacterium rouxii]